MRASNIFKRQDCKTSNLLLWITFIVYVLVISFIGSRHEHWFDEWHVWFMCRDNSILSLIKATAKEGHFFPWQLLNFPFVKLGCGFGCLEVISCALCSIGAWILLFKAPFRYLCKVLLLGSFSMLYSFPVLARCYALIPPIIFSIGYLYPKLPRHKYLYCFFIGFLSLTHSYMEGMAGALFLLFCYEHLYLPHKHRLSWKSNIGPAFLAGGMLFITFLIVIIAAKSSQGYNSRINSSIELNDQLFKTYSILPLQSMSLTGSIKTPNLDLSITSAVWITVIVCLYKCLWRNAAGKRLAIIGFISIAYMFIFGTSIYFMALQRLLLPFFVIIALIWCNYHTSIDKYISILIISLVAMTSFNHYKEIKEDILKSYCKSVETAEFIHGNIAQDAIIAQGKHYDFIGQLLEEDYTSFELASKDSVFTDAILDKFVEEHPCTSFYPVCMAKCSYQGQKYNFKCIFDHNAADAIYYGFYVYKVEGKTEELSPNCENF